MPRDVQTNVTITAKTKGFADTQQQAAKILATAQKGAQAQVRGFAEVGKAVQKLTDQLKGLAGKQLELNEALGGAKKGSEEYKKLSDSLKGVQTDAQRVERVILAVNKAFKQQTAALKEQAAHGAFFQGFMQGAVPGAPWLQRGPGMGRQALGQATGHIARGVAGGLMSTPFAGISGIAQAAQAIPGAGPLVAGGLETAAGFAGPAMEYERQRMEALPFLRHAMGAEQAAQASRQKKLEAFGLTPEGIEAAAKRAGNAAVTSGKRIPVTDLGAIGGAKPITPDNILADVHRRAAGSAIRSMQEQQAARALAEGEERKSLSAAARRIGGAPPDTMQGIGQRYGYAKPEIMQLASGLTQAGGGTGEGLSGGFLAKATAAKRALGIDEQLSGAFLGADRRGGLSGAGKDAGKSLEDAISKGFSLGLEGSELVDFVAQIADGINTWKSTGIPMAKDALSDIAESLGWSGMSGVRAQAVAGGVTQAAQGLAQRGLPQSPAELMMLRTMGGFNAGGAEDLLRSRMKMERGDFGGDEQKKLFGDLIKGGGGGATGLQVAFDQLKGMGVNMGLEEFARLGVQDKDERKRLGITDDPLADKQAQRMADGAFKVADSGGVEALGTDAMAKFGSVIREQTALQNKQLEIGRQLVPTLNTFNQAAANLAGTLTDKTNPEMRKFADWLERLTSSAPPMVMY